MLFWSINLFIRRRLSRGETPKNVPSQLLAGILFALLGAGTLHRTKSICEEKEGNYVGCIKMAFDNSWGNANPRLHTDICRQTQPIIWLASALSSDSTLSWCRDSPFWSWQQGFQKAIDLLFFSQFYEGRGTYAGARW